MSDNSAMNTVSSGFIEEDGSVKALSYGTPLEMTLHVKRRRLSTSSPRIVEQVESSPVPSTSRGALLELHTGSPVAPVAEEYETCGGSGRNTPKSVHKPFHPRRSLRESDIEIALNYGSEDDSDEEGGEEENLFSAFIPRVGRMFLDAEEEENLPSSVVPEAASTSSAPSTPPPVKPSELFDFDWRTLPDPPVSPTERREVFSQNNCGPTAPFLTPYDAFIAIWDQDIMEYIAAETNRYAQEVVEKQLQEGTLAPNSRTTNWRDTDANELYVYFGFLLAIGMRVKSDLKEYWVKDDCLSTPNLAQYMTYNRFMVISRCLHFTPNSPHIALFSRPHAKLYKIDPILQHLNSRFQSLYRLNRNIALDESLTQWKGWLNIKQFNKNKVASVGIKTFEVYESQSGYLWRFKMYAEHEEEAEREVTPVSGVMPTLALELLKGLEYKGHTVWMDNYYNSPSLARVLKSLGFDCVGTLRTNRQFVPRQISTLTKSKMTVGEVVSCTSGDVDIVVWRGHNRVALLSTYHGAAVHTACGKTEPIVIHDYNVCMGGVDKKDQILCTYPFERKCTQAWYKKLFQRLLNISVLNALVLHKQSSLPNSYKHKNHRNFRHDLIKNLFQRHFTRPTLASSLETRMGVGRSEVPNVPILPADVLKHFPKKYGSPHSKNKRIRHYCVVCRKRVLTYCPECNVPLCVFKCIKTYHSRLSGEG